jgi:flavorubredoxin
MSSLPPKELLIVYHSQSGCTERLAAAIESSAASFPGITVRRITASEIRSEDILHCTVMVICSPEYFGYMAGAVKDMFDRTYEALLNNVIGKPYALMICAGNDGTGASASMERIIAGLKMRRIQPPLICKGPVSEEYLTACRTLGETLAAGMDFGIY